MKKFKLKVEVEYMITIEDQAQENVLMELVSTLEQEITKAQEEQTSQFKIAHRLVQLEENTDE